MKKIRNTKKMLSAICVGLIGLGMTGTASASLLGRLPATPGGTNYQAYYDNVANLTWLADANYAKTSGYAAANANWLSGSTATTTTNTISAEGWMGWAAANTWATNLTVNGVGGWRLPTTLVPDTTCSFAVTDSVGFNCTGSEMGDLYYNVLGGIAGSDIITTHNANYNLFSNISNDPDDVGVFWSATELAPDTSQAWIFAMILGKGNGLGGFQVPNIKKPGLSSSAWAIHSGDVNTVPLPAAGWLFGSGLFGLIGVAKRKHANI